MRILKYLLFLVGWIGVISLAAAQGNATKTASSADSSAIFWFHNTIDSSEFPIFNPYDSTLWGIEKSNPSWNEAAFSDLGNIGQAQQNMIFGYQRASGFHYKEIPYYSYIRNSDKPVFYRSTLPYSELYYHIGSKKEQVLGLNFSRNIYRGLTFGIHFDLTHCLGSYSNQQASTNDFAVNLRYFTPNRRYGVIGEFTRYKINAYENGGIVSDSVFESQTIRPEAISVNLKNGSTTIRNYGFELTQYFYITKAPPKVKNVTPISKPDTLFSDSIYLSEEEMDTLFSDHKPLMNNSFFEKRRFNWGRLGWNVKTSDLAWLYSNQNIPKNYFPVSYNDSLKTHDSSHFFIFENTFSYSNANLNTRNAPNQFRYYFFLKYQYVDLHVTPFSSYDSLASVNHGIDFSSNMLIPKIQIATKLFSTFEFRASGDYVASGYNSGDFSLSGNLSNTFGKGSNQTKFQIDAMAALQMPDWFFYQYSGNHYRWENDFGKVNYYMFGGSLSNKWFQLSGHYFLLSDYVYLNENALPESTSDIQNVLRIGLKSKIQLGKHWILDNFLAYQETFDSDVLHLPKFIYNGSFYYNFSLFKQTLNLTPGISLFYNTLYNSDAYTPALNSFYLQNEKSIGNYLYADVFIDILIKRARIFIKYRHFDKGMMGYNYYMVPHYPQIGGGFYAGVSWRFIN